MRILPYILLPMVLVFARQPLVDVTVNMEDPFKTFFFYLFSYGILGAALLSGLKVIRLATEAKEA